MADGKPQTAEERAQRRAGYLAGLIWHAGTFVIINGFFWLLDLMGTGGITWSFWITLTWGLGLAFHALAYLVDGRQLEERKTEQYLEEERKRAGL